MNLLRHIDVLWRGRVIIAIGLVVAILMATFALFKVSDGGLSYRKPETWASSTKLLITQPGFPWGRSVLPSSAAEDQKQAGQASVAPTGRDQKKPRGHLRRPEPLLVPGLDLLALPDGRRGPDDDPAQARGHGDPRRPADRRWQPERRDTCR